MALYVVIVIGFMVLLGFVGFTIMHYIKKALVAHDAERIDPKPTTKY